MAVFKVGDKGRIVGAVYHPENIGLEAIVVGPLMVRKDSGSPRATYLIEVPKRPHPIFDQWTILPEHLAPLTDPRCSDFIADMERFAKLHKSPIQKLKELFGEGSK